MVAVQKFADREFQNPLHFLIKQHRAGQSKYLPSGHLKVIEAPWDTIQQLGKMLAGIEGYEQIQPDWRGTGATPFFYAPDLPLMQYVEGKRTVDPGLFFADRQIVMPKSLYNEGTGDPELDQGHSGIESYPDELSKELLDPVALGSVLLHELRHHQQYNRKDGVDGANGDFTESEREADLRAFQYLRSHGYSAEDIANVWRYLYLSPPFGNIAGNLIKRNDYTRAYLDQFLDQSIPASQREEILNSRRYQSSTHHHVGRTLDVSKAAIQLQDTLIRRGFPGQCLKTGTSFSLPEFQKGIKLKAPISVSPLPAAEFYRTMDPKYVEAGKGSAYLWHTPVNTLQWIFDGTDDRDFNAFLQFASLGSPIAPARANK
jgi:hypothetical protein